MKDAKMKKTNKKLETEKEKKEERIYKNDGGERRDWLRETLVSFDIESWRIKEKEWKGNKGDGD